MKSRIVILLLLVTTFSASGQLRFHHILRQNSITSYGFTLKAGTPPGTPINLCTERYGVITVSGGNINVDIWQITDPITCAGGLDGTTAITNLRLVDNRVTYGMPTRVLVVPFRAVNLGVNTLPFRIRRKVKVEESGVVVPATGTTAFQLALNVGYTWGFSQVTTRAITNWSATLGGYLGPSTADLKKETVHYPSSWTANQTNASLTYGFNLIVARNNLGLVFAYGWERAMGKNRGEWIYHGKPYLAFGINTSFMR